MVALKNTAINVLALGAMVAFANADATGTLQERGSPIEERAATQTTSTPGTLSKNGCYYTVPGAGTFTTNMNYSWNNYLTLLTSGIGVVQDLLSSVYTVAAGNSPLPRRFDLVNIGVSLGTLLAQDPALALTVPGGQTKGPISSAQITTAYSDILYGTVRTVAKISSVPGVTHGFSFYSNDTQEIDFAFLTGDTTVVHLTNEQVNSSSPATSYTVKAPTDATTAYHEYRVDWLPGKTSFYIDNVNVQNITTNVPTTPGFWLWNNWSNGNAWAAGPPTSDAILKIRSIDGYFNRTTVLSSYALASTTCNL